VYGINHTILNKEFTECVVDFGCAKFVTKGHEGVFEHICVDFAVDFEGIESLEDGVIIISTSGLVRRCPWTSRPPPPPPSPSSTSSPSPPSSPISIPGDGICSTSYCFCMLGGDIGNHSTLYSPSDLCLYWTNILEVLVIPDMVEKLPLECIQFGIPLHNHLNVINFDIVSVNPVQKLHCKYCIILEKIVNNWKQFSMVFSAFKKIFTQHKVEPSKAS